MKEQNKEQKFEVKVTVDENGVEHAEVIMLDQKQDSDVKESKQK
mgnify:CR=1 FL=1